MVQEFAEVLVLVCREGNTIRHQMVRAWHKVYMQACVGDAQQPSSSLSLLSLSLSLSLSRCLCLQCRSARHIYGPTSDQRKVFRPQAPAIEVKQRLGNPCKIRHNALGTRAQGWCKLSASSVQTPSAIQGGSPYQQGDLAMEWRESKEDFTGSDASSVSPSRAVFLRGCGCPH